MGDKNDNGYEKIEVPQVGDSHEGVPVISGGEVLGVDVSHFQGPVDWKKLYSLGYFFAFAKATDGANGRYAMFEKHKAGAKAAGMIFGAYHFFRFKDDPAKQMHNFMTVAGTVEPGELPHTLDLEWDRTSPKYSEGHEMDEEAADLAFMAANTLALSIRMLPIIYTNAYFFNPGVRGDSYKQMPLWVPSYKPKRIEDVKIPKPWTKATFWQYSESLSFGGVDKIDGNKFIGSYEQLKALTK